MQETTKIYLRKIAAKVKDISTHLPAERTTEREARATKPLPSDSPTQQKKTDHPTPRPAEKSKKHRIPFVALALAMVFTSLCIFSLLGQQPFVQATTADLQHTAARSLDHGPKAVPTTAASCLETNSCWGGGPPTTPAPDGSPMSGDYIFKTPCTNNMQFLSYSNDTKNPNNSVCWD